MEVKKDSPTKHKDKLRRTTPSSHIFDKETGETFSECKKNWQKGPKQAVDRKA